eukprot:Em0832g2a
MEDFDQLYEDELELMREMEDEISDHPRPRRALELSSPLLTPGSRKRPSENTPLPLLNLDSPVSSCERQLSSHSVGPKGQPAVSQETPGQYTCRDKARPVLHDVGNAPGLELPPSSPHPHGYVRSPSPYSLTPTPSPPSLPNDWLRKGGVALDRHKGWWWECVGGLGRAGSRSGRRRRSRECVTSGTWSERHGGTLPQDGGVDLVESPAPPPLGEGGASQGEGTHPDPPSFQTQTSPSSGVCRGACGPQPLLGSREPLSGVGLGRVEVGGSSPGHPPALTFLSLALMGRGCT